jgi:hypothetical protein
MKFLFGLCLFFQTVIFKPVPDQSSYFNLDFAEQNEVKVDYNQVKLTLEAHKTQGINLILPAITYFQSSVILEEGSKMLRPSFKIFFFWAFSKVLRI